MHETKDLMTVKGCYRLQIEDDGEIVGDSGWRKNVVVTQGFQNICLLIGTSLTGSQWSHANVGTNGAPATNATSLPSEVTGTSGAVQRAAVTAATQAGSKTLRFTATLSSANSFVTQSETINNVGLFIHSSAAASLQAGASYTASSVGTNQNVKLLASFAGDSKEQTSQIRGTSFQDNPEPSNKQIDLLWILLVSLWACVETRGEAPGNRMKG